MKEDFEYSQMEYDDVYGAVCDLIPYDDPEYEKKVHETVLSILWSEKHPDPYLEEICKQHDDMLDEGLIDW